MCVKMFIIVDLSVADMMVSLWLFNIFESTSDSICFHNGFAD